MNPLPLIALFLEQNKGQCRDISRAALVSWLRARTNEEHVELAADSMIAAGIGIQQEQTQTVYCRVTYA